MQDDFRTSRCSPFLSPFRSSQGGQVKKFNGCSRHIVPEVDLVDDMVAFAGVHRLQYRYCLQIEFPKEYRIGAFREGVPIHIRPVLPTGKSSLPSV